MNSNVIVDKSFQFAIQIINLYKYLVIHKKEYILSRQVLRCGTSVGANIEEAEGGFSRKDFTAKMSIAYKEARETKYWLRLLKETDYVDNSKYQDLIMQCEEILKILYHIINTSRTN